MVAKASAALDSWGSALPGLCLPLSPFPLSAPDVFFLEGLLAGVVPVFFVGPVLFTLLNAALEDGLAAGLQVAVGVALSDAVAIALCASVMGPVLTGERGQWILQLVGGAILLAFGVAMTIRGGRQPDTDTAARSRHRRNPLLAGFVINFLNPFVFTFWVGALGALGARHPLTPSVLLPFFGGMVTTIFVTDCAKAWAAGTVQRRLGSRAIGWVRQGSGALLALGGAALLAHGLTGWGLA